jgi:hypothetical protein
MRKSIFIWVVCAFMALCPAPSRAQVALDNQSVVKMVKAGLDDAVIFSMIKGQPGTYDISPDAVIALKKDGVSDRVISAMTEKAPPSINEYDGLEIGVYYRTPKTSGWVEVPSEKVYAKSGGALKNIATHGIIKTDMNGRLDGASSKLGVSAPLEFLIITPDGVEGTDFTLVDLVQKKDAREFRTLTGGVFHSTQDVNKNNVPFEQKKLARHTYKVVFPPNMGKGEYAFLAAGISGTSASGSRGKAYTFHVTE